VTSGTLKKEAVRGITATLKGANLDRNTEFMDGDRLWELVQKHLPERAFFQRMKEAQRILTRVIPDHDFVAKTSASGVEIQMLGPKGPSSKPFEFGVRFGFPRTDEGEKARQQLQSFFESGSAVSIPSSCIEEFAVPESLQTLLGGARSDGFVLNIGPQRVDRSIPVRMRITTQGRESEMGPIVLQVESIGSKQLTLSNSEQEIPWRILMVGDREGHRMEYNFSRNKGAWNVRAELEAAEFWEGLSTGGHLSVISLETGLELIGGDLPESPDTAPQPGWLELLSAVKFIQERTGVPITVPDRSILGEEAAFALEYAARLRNGATKMSVDSLTVEVDRNVQESLIRELRKPDGPPLTLTQSEEIQIFDTPVPLGRVVYTCRANIPDEEEARINAHLSESEEEFGKVRLQVPSGEVNVIYEKWYDGGLEPLDDSSKQG